MAPLSPIQWQCQKIATIKNQTAFSSRRHCWVLITFSALVSDSLPLPSASKTWSANTSHFNKGSKLQGRFQTRIVLSWSRGSRSVVLNFPSFSSAAFFRETYRIFLTRTGLLFTTQWMLVCDEMKRNQITWQMNTCYYPLQTVCISKVWTERQKHVSLQLALFLLTDGWRNFWSVIGTLPFHFSP